MSAFFNRKISKLPTRAAARAELKRLNVATLNPKQVHDALWLARELGLIQAVAHGSEQVAQLQAVQRGL